MTVGRAALGALLLALGTPSCTSTGATPVVAARLRPAAEAAPITRLGRWNGRGFVAVAPASIVGGDVTVLVHGWEPGYLEAVRRHRGASPLLLWDPAAVNAAGVAAGDGITALASTIAAADPRGTVLAYSWLDGAATSTDPLAARRAAAATDLEGQRLSFALTQAESPSFAAGDGRLHLVGHSFGAKVATVAAIGLDRPPSQLTLLDSPENEVPDAVGVANHLEGYLPLLPLGRRPGTVFVDSYRSLFGAPYGSTPGLHDVVDVRLFPAQYPLGDIVDRHEYPMRWYAKSASDVSAGVGAAWSPFLGGDPARLARAYDQDWARRGGGVQRGRELDLRPARPPQARATSHLPLRAMPVHVAVGGADYTVLSRSHPRWQVEFTRAPGDLGLEFDARFTVASDAVAVWIDGTQRFGASGAWAGTTARRAVIDVSALAPGSHTFTAVLAPTGATSGQYALGGLRTLGDPASGRSRGLSTGARIVVVLLAVLALVVVLLAALVVRLRPRDPVG